MRPVLLLIWLSLAVSTSHAQTHKIDSNSSTYAGSAESDEAFRRKTDARNGMTAYKACASCHLPSGAGRSDGTFPQLAGQHATVLIKQMTDIRAGRRDNPAMYPFVMTLADPQEVADLAAYIARLCIPADHGKYQGRDISQQIALGRQLYEKACVACHGPSGEGNREKLYPVIAGQHYKYLLRQMKDIREGRRHNANPEMKKLIANYSDADLTAISAYQASLEMPGAMCKPGAKK